MRKSIFILAVAALALAGTGCNQLQSRAQLNAGVSAFKSAQYPEAVEHFKTAVQLEPGFNTARLYLATAYMQQWIPGAVSPENERYASEAYNQFQKVLEDDPKNKVAIGYIASLFLNEKKWDEANQWYQKMIAVDPKNADAYYSLGFISWSRWYPAYAGARHDIGMKQDEAGPIKDKKVKAELLQKYGPMIDEGLQDLDKCLAVDPDRDDAMAYENLLIREKADLLDSKDEYNKQIAVADNWVVKALAAKKAVAEKKAKAAAANGITEDTGK